MKIENTHKKIAGLMIAGALLVSSFLLHPSSLPAQVIGFGGSTAILGTVNSSPVDTNSAGINVRRLTFSLSGMTNASTLFTGAVYLSTSPSSLNNALLLGQFTNFGSANMSTNFAAYYTNPPLYVILQGGSGTPPSCKPSMGRRRTKREMLAASH